MHIPWLITANLG